MRNKRKIRFKRKKEIYVVLVAFILVFAGLIYNFSYFLIKDSDNFIYSSYNTRFSTYADNIIRGNILTSDGQIIATTQTEDDKEYRYYPYAEMFSHAVGYVDEGMSGLESEYSFDLLKCHSSLIDQIQSDDSDKKILGDCLVTTLDFDAQKAAYDGMGDYKGAVVAIEPDTGRVICMVSKPDFDPNSISSYWDFITDDDNDSSILLNRATSGQYPPGSTFKILTTVAYLRQNNNDTSGFSYDCNGTYKTDDFTIHCSSNKKHGQENFKDAFANSCNSAFAYIGLGLDRNEYIDTCEDLLMNAKLPTDISDVKQSKFSISNETSDEVLAQTAIGQGDTSVTPLYMCMLVSAIANDGLLMKPYMTDFLQSSDGFMVHQYSPSEYGSILSQEECNILNEYMSAVIADGTADDVDFGDLTVYGKTGTAQFSDASNDAHSWFVGYAKNASGKKLAIAVIMEEAGYGSKYAAPLAADVFDAYFN